MTGGRFDNLISHFIPHGTKKDLYAIGLRIDGLALLKAKIDYEALRQIENIGDVDREIYIVSNETMFKEKLILGNKLWTRGYKVNFNVKTILNFEKFIEQCKKKEMDYLIVLSQGKWQHHNKVRVYDLKKVGKNEEYELNEFLRFIDERVKDPFKKSSNNQAGRPR